MEQGVRCKSGQSIGAEQRRLWQSCGPRSICEAYAPGNSLVEHDQTECRPAKLVRYSPGFGKSGCECCADPGVVGHKLCARDGAGEGYFGRPRRSTLERVQYQL